jgi:hypothetical protein
MAKATTVTVSPEINAHLILLKAELHAAGMSTTSNADVVAGLILGARRSPVEAVKAVIETHVAAEGAAALPGVKDEHEPGGDDQAAS